MEIVSTLINGVLLGGLYCLFAAGLTLIFGVMRLVNIAHGDLIVLASYIALVAADQAGLHPLAAIVVVIPAMAAIGYGLQRAALNRTLGPDILPPLLVTFGLAVIIQNGLLLQFSADSQRLLAGNLDTASFTIVPGLAIGVLPLMSFAVAAVLVFGLHHVFFNTRLGMRFRAVADDRATAELIGLNTRHVFGLTMALCCAVIGLAGIFIGIKTVFDPAAGPQRLLIAFEAVIIAGLGNIRATLAGGILLGLGQAVGALIHPGLQILGGHIVFLAVLFFRPQGLFPLIRE